MVLILQVFELHLQHEYKTKTKNKRYDIIKMLNKSSLKLSVKKEHFIVLIFI